MSLPTPPNTTCDIYLPANAPPSSPDAEGVAAFLRPAYRRGLEIGEDSDVTELEAKFTHVLLIDASVTEVQDGHSAAGFVVSQSSSVYIPDKDGTEFIAVFVERPTPGGAQDHKRVYLRRHTVTWPTDEL